MRDELEQRRIDTCDVVVVGAGLVGAAVAARLARAGVDTAILEAQETAGGATRRSAGMTLTGLTGSYKEATKTYGRQKARKIWSLTIEGRERLIEAAEQQKIPIGNTGSLTLATGEAEAKALKESATLLREDGFDVQFYPSDPLARGFTVALRHPADATVNAAALTQSLLDNNDVTVHERTEVHDLESEGGKVRVWAQRRTVLCNAVVLAVNGYAPLLDSWFVDKITPTRTLTFSTEPMNEIVLEQPCCVNTSGGDYKYCRQLPDRRLLLSDRHRPSHNLSRQSNGERDMAGLNDAAKDRLTRFTRHYFPEVKIDNVDLESGVLGLTPDGLPLIGRLPDRRQVHFAIGLGGQGLAWAIVIAERVVKFLLHDIDPGILSAARLD